MQSSVQWYGFSPNILMKYDKYIKYNYFRKPPSEYLILNLADLKLIYQDLLDFMIFWGLLYHGMIFNPTLSGGGS